MAINKHSNQDLQNNSAKAEVAAISDTINQGNSLNGETLKSEISAADGIVQVSELLGELDEVELEANQKQQIVANQNQLIQVRLGLASSLFTAMRARHEATASHCLRVALSCSSWALASGLDEEVCHHIELAALLHDIGKIGVPDNVLLKPRSLTSDEISVMDRHWKYGVQILKSCSAPEEVLDILRYCSCWYQSSQPQERQKSEIPLGARMLAIIDAFDAMTTDHVYRRAMSRERALDELHQFSGTQFDPDLVNQFSELCKADRLTLSELVSERWLHKLDPNFANTYWRMNQTPTPCNDAQPRELFQQKLLDNMHDGVIFVDYNLKITLWNRGIERLTSTQSDGVLQQQWSPSLLQMRDERGDEMSDNDCPVIYAIETGVQSLRRLTIAGPKNQNISVNVHTVAVVDSEGTMLGATLLLHDVSSETSLEERCLRLHEKATQDPLTKIANRAEFDRVHEQFVAAHLERGLPCALIISDLDLFKKINDTYGHQAGDEALIVFAQLLKKHCRPGDLVARYGGEEFVILCADCNNSTGVSRAESLRKELVARKINVIGGRNITASFGVTEVQEGDTPATMLARADRALLQAKQYGRNRVVQLGSGMNEEEKSRGFFNWLSRGSGKPDQLAEQYLSTSVPLKVAIEKLRGFIADHFAKVQSIDKNDVVLLLEGGESRFSRRNSDRIVPFIVELKFSEERSAKDEQQPNRGPVRTIVHIVIRPKKNRDRRRAGTLERSSQILASLRSYLMATITSPPEKNVIQKATNALATLMNVNK